MQNLRVIIADDHPVFRRGLRQVIEAEPDLQVIAEAEDGVAALALLREHRPAVAVLDLDMPRMDGFEVIRILQQERLGIGIVILTMHKDEDLFNEAITLNVQGYILKDSAVNDIAGSIRAVASGQFFVSAPLSTYLINRNRRAAALASVQPGVADLTPTERRILNLIAEYKTNKEIAAQLFLSHRTVENHRANISQKLDLRGTHALLRFSLEHKSELD
jgi:DNA-binding NarL/FixJ family response regulator